MPVGQSYEGSTKRVLINKKRGDQKMKKLRASKASIMVLTLLMLSACGSLRPVDPPPIVQHPYIKRFYRVREGKTKREYQ